MPQSVLDAAYNVVTDYPGGAASLAPRIDKAASTLAQEVNGTPQAKLGLGTAVKITQRSGDLRILLAFAAECGQMCLPLPEGLDASEDDCLCLAGAAAREFAELMSEVIAARADGKTSDNELARITRAVGEMSAVLHRLNAQFVASNLAGKPAALAPVSKAA